MPAKIKTLTTYSFRRLSKGLIELGQIGSVETNKIIHDGGKTYHMYKLFGKSGNICKVYLMYEEQEVSLSFIPIIVLI